MSGQTTPSIPDKIIQEWKDESDVLAREQWGIKQDEYIIPESSDEVHVNISKGDILVGYKSCYEKMVVPLIEENKRLRDECSVLKNLLIIRGVNIVNNL